MFLKDLIEILEEKQVSGPLSREISAVSYDSRETGSNSIFVAIPGSMYDGAEFIGQAVQSGAAAVVSEKDVQAPKSVAKIKVPSARRAMALLSAKLYNFPSRRMKVIGVTGTNGKTTICYLLEAILKAAGHKTGVIGTVGARIDGKSFPTKLTTPESADLQRILSEMVKKHVKYVVMEVSSHSIVQGRVFGTEFDAAVFSNLTHDHLDFHGSVEAYLGAKLNLFRMLSEGNKTKRFSVVNIDDPHSEDFIKASPVGNITYGLNNADFSARDIKTSIDGSSFILSGREGDTSLTTLLPGDFNVHNVLAAFACAFALGVSKEVISGALSSFKCPPGRFERVEAGQSFPVIVDFAHSPDSLDKMLDAVRRFTKGRVILVFGCPGDRDRDKRPIMGEIAAKKADIVIISTDDPHTEDPQKIINEIEAGVNKATGHGSRVTDLHKIADRKKAIEEALKTAEPGDLVLIAGRGHEKFQDFNGKKVELDDREVVRKFFAGIGL